MYTTYNRYNTLMLIVALVGIAISLHLSAQATNTAYAETVVYASATVKLHSVAQHVSPTIVDTVRSHRADYDTHSPANVTNVPTADRPDACRTWAVWPHVGGLNAYNGLSCGNGDNAQDKREPDLDSVYNTPNIPVPDNDDTTPPDDNNDDTDGDVDVPDNDDTSEDDNKGNPGNDKPVGNAGEKCNKNMCENPDGESGEHGKSKND